ncbi:MAG: YqaJ viral recombinase family protein [Enterobacter hormaechei]
MRLGVYRLRSTQRHQATIWEEVDRHENVLFHTLLAEVCTGVAPEVNAKALAWGKQYEEDARTLFEVTTDVKVTESPILVRDESMRTACSPDGLCSNGFGLELKCPFTSRDFMKFRLGGFEAIKSAYMAHYSTACG